MTNDDTALTPASRTALAHYRKRAEECRAEPVTIAGLMAASTWDALADELATFGETTSEHDDGQEELL